MNLVRDVSSGKNPPETVNVVVENPMGSNNKYEVDENGGYIKLDRVLHSAMYWPVEYGFIPQTRSGDGDSLDAMVIATRPTFPGCVVACRPIGAIDMEDDGGKDTKIICVPIEKLEPRLAEIKDINDVPLHVRKEIEHFLADYKKLEPGKWTKIQGWLPKSKAFDLIRKDIEAFKKEQKK
ncbi:inorganic diphosphatase [Candidatus Micrarchaeota archaeon]|nr:inorganic diphosphatase [Candidatus Micrarchaeota archaeon]